VSAAVVPVVLGSTKLGVVCDFFAHLVNRVLRVVFKCLGSKEWQSIDYSGGVKQARDFF